MRRTELVEVRSLFLNYFCYYRILLLLSTVFWGTLAYAAELPLLGGGKAINSAGEFISTAASFYGGASLGGAGYQSYLKATPSATVSIQARIIVDPVDVGKQADLLYVAGFEGSAPFDGGIDTTYVTLSETNDLYDLDLYNSASVWMAQLAEFPFKSGVTLESEMVIDDVAGWVLAGDPNVSYYFVGYRLQEGTVVYTAVPIVISTVTSESSNNSIDSTNTIEVSDGAKIYYEVAGEGTPLLLIHGGEFTDEGQPKGSPSWDPQYQEFSQHFKTIRLDLRGFGRSTLVGEHPLDSWIWGKTEHRATTDVVELLNALKIPKAHILGLSIGSAVAAQLAVFHPEMVDKLILASPWYMNTLPGNPAQMDKLKAITDKTLFIGGANDFQYSMELMFGETVSYFPKAETIENADHFCNRDQPAEFNKLVLDFLADTASSIDLCTYSFEPTVALSFSQQTQYGETTVTTQPGCQWTASSNTDWITIVSGNSGNGTGIVTYAVVPNLSPNLKTGTVTIAGKTVTVTISAIESTEPVDSTNFLNLPVLKNYTFIGKETKVLPGKSTESTCSGTISNDDQIGRLALVSLFYQNGCYTDGRYNHNDYRVDQGFVSDAASQLQFEAYRINEPSRKASDFLASEHAVYYRFPTQENYTIYLFDGTGINKVLEVPASQIDATQFTKLESLTVSNIKGSATYLFVPSQQRVSVFTELGNGIEGAQIGQNVLGKILKYRYAVTGHPFDTQSGFNYGPATHSNVYSYTRQFFLVQKSNGSLGIVWQDQEDNSIQVTWLGSDLQSQQTMELPYFPNYDLAAATSDEMGAIYYLIIQQGSGISESGGADTARTVKLYKVNESGQVLAQTDLDTSATGLNVVDFGKSNIASLKYLNGKLGLILGRRMHRLSDGLNHQGAIAVVFDANTLAIDKNWGQTSGHSFESVLTTNSQGEFVGIDLADNYPRGVHLHKFNPSQMRSRVVYTFKTQHGDSATSPAGVSYPVYSEISGSTTYYRWSNDNRTYTELGGVIEANSGYTVIFAGEATPDGRALDNARVGDYLNDPRNIGLVQVQSNFEQSPYGSENMVTDDLIRTHGITETGGFYTFGGNWSEQRNTGVIWLTHYQDKTQENVSRLKTVKLADGNILILWEKWTPDSYINTYAMKIDEIGNPLTDIVELGTQVRLNRRDDIWRIGNAVYLIAGDGDEGKLELIIVK